MTWVFLIALALGAAGLAALSFYVGWCAVVALAAWLFAPGPMQSPAVAWNRFVIELRGGER